MKTNEELKAQELSEAKAKVFAQIRSKAQAQIKAISEDKVSLSIFNGERAKKENKVISKCPEVIACKAEKAIIAKKQEGIIGNQFPEIIHDKELRSATLKCLGLNLFGKPSMDSSIKTFEQGADKVIKNSKWKGEGE